MYGMSSFPLTVSYFSRWAQNALASRNVKSLGILHDDLHDVD